MAKKKLHYLEGEQFIEGHYISCTTAVKQKMIQTYVGKTLDSVCKISVINTLIII